MRCCYALAAAAVLLAAPAAGNNRLALQDEFDPALLRIAEEQHLGRVVPDVAIVTESGTERLIASMHEQPTILVLAYYTCGHTCPVTVQSLARVLPIADAPKHRVLVLSFDANDDLDTLRHVKSTLEQIPANWTFGLLPDQDITRLTESVGFRFFFSERDQIFIHPAALVFLSPRGEVMRYLYGSEPAVRDIELALIESRDRAPRLNELVDMVRLTCFQFDASRSRYVLHPAVIFGSLGIGILGFTGLLALAYRPARQGE